MNIGLQSMFYKYKRSVNWWDQGQKDAAVKHLDLRCCRRDSAAFQAVVSSDEEDFLATAGRDALLWKGGPLKIIRCELDTDAPVRTEIRWVGLIGDDNGTPTADALLDDVHVFVAKRSIQPVWVELHASESAAPGRYSGRIRFYAHTMFEDEVLVETLSFTLAISEASLPEPSDYSFYLDLWQHNCNIARKYEVPYWSDAHFDLLDRYLHSLGQLGQKALTLIVSEEPWSGQSSFIDAEPSDLNEYSIVPVRKSMDGQFHCDFSAMDRYVALGESHGIAREIEIFGLINIWTNVHAGYGGLMEGHPDAVRIRYFDEAEGCFRFMRKTEEFAEYVSMLEAHFSEMGWTQRVRIVADEPESMDVFRQSLDFLRTTAPSLRYKAAINHTSFISENIEGIEDYVPALNCAAEEHEKLLKLKRDLNGTVAYYVCCSPEKPNTFLSSPAIEARVIPWLAEGLQLDGFLRWNYTVWPDDPLRKLSYRPTIWKAGDTNFVYPGKLGAPLLSLRYKWLQRGIRDYEYMQLLKRSGLQAELDGVLEGVLLFRSPQELSPASGLKAEQLYSFNPEHYDRLYEIGVPQPASS
ncbi:DUF4091 domain-containing protein [Paenibacillus humicus]|uniref:DUF4091 domain-containing protein n=1 Tax=Paenibacillus humicus TaxID=412861 RepID=UPI003F14DE5F